MTETPQPEAEPQPATFPSDRTVKLAIMGVFVILAVAAFHLAEDFLLPVTLAFLLALILSPIIRTLRRSGVPEGVSAVLVVAILTIGLFGTIHTLSGPVTKMIDDAPQIGIELRKKLEAVREPLEAVKEAQKKVDEATRSETSQDVQQVEVRKDGLFDQVVGKIPHILASTALVLVLLLFLLASGDMYYEKIVRSMPTVRDKKRWLRIVYDVEREVSRYLFAVTVINIALGTVVAFGLWMIGLPNPLLWGLLTALLNFVPYLGALTSIVLVAVVSLVHFPTFGAALIAPAIVAGCCSIEGQFITPTLVGRSLRMNAVAVFMAIAFWGWMWGVVGALMAVPLLITLKVFAEHAEGLEGLGEFLGARSRKTPKQIVSEPTKNPG